MDNTTFKTRIALRLGSNIFKQNRYVCSAIDNEKVITAWAVLRVKGDYQDMVNSSNNSTLINLH